MSGHKYARNGNIEWGEGKGEALKMHNNLSSPYGSWPRLSEYYVFNLDINIYKIKNTSCRNIQKCTYVLVLLDNTSKVILVFLNIER
jgi:hypothetical protein